MMTESDLAGAPTDSWGFTDFDKLKAAQRELAMRRALYPKWVHSGKMKQPEADKGIAIMAAIEEDYAAKCKAAE